MFCYYYTLLISKSHLPLGLYFLKKKACRKYDRLLSLFHILNYQLLAFRNNHVTYDFSNPKLRQRQYVEE